jgi:hypothetical protein
MSNAKGPEPVAWLDAFGEPHRHRSDIDADENARPLYLRAEGSATDSPAPPASDEPAAFTEWFDSLAPAPYYPGFEPYWMRAAQPVAAPEPLTEETLGHLAGIMREWADGYQSSEAVSVILRAATQPGTEGQK